jgi:polyketide synthase PksJ
MKVEKSNVQDIWPLRPLQEGMLFHYLQGGEAGQYLERLVLSIKGKIEDVLFEESWRIVFRHNDALRSIFKWEGLKQPVQLVLRSLKPPLAIYDFTEWAEPGERGPQYRSPQAFRHMFGGASAGNLERAQTMGELMDGVELDMKSREQEMPLDLKEGAFRITLCKFRSECRLFLTFHHIVLDGWSLGIILEEWLTAYRMLALGNTPAKPMKTSFKSYLTEVKKNHDAGMEAGFWAGYLKDYEIKQNIQPFYPPHKQRFKRLSRRLPEKATALVRDMCADCGISAATFMYGVWSILLQRFKHAEDIVFGTTVSGRSLDVERIDTIAGLLINTIPLRIGSRDSERASAFFRRIHEELGARRPYELTGLKDIKTYGGFKGPEELFDTLVVFENYPLGRVLMDNPVPTEEGKGQDSGKQDIQGTYGTQGTQGTQEIQGSHGQLSICAYEMEEHTHYPLTLLIRENGSYELEFIYDTTVYEYYVVKQMSECFEYVLGSIARSPEQELSSLQIARAEDLHMNTYLNNSTIREYPVDRTIAELFAVAMAGHADQTAIVHEDGVMTYRELDELSDLIAGELIRRGAGAEQCVGIQSHRSPEMIAGLLAVLKTGAAYVPIHPDYPQERKRYIAGDSGISILLGGSEADYPLYDSMGIKTLNLAGPWARSQVEDSALKRGASDIPAGERLACIVYTSGSTGQPKGIMIEQRGIIRLVKNTEFAEFRRSDVVLPTCPLEFDVSNFEIWGALLNGSTLCLISGEKLLMPRTLKESLLQHKVSLMWLTTPLFNQMARTEPSLFRSLRCLLVGGDALSPVCVNKVREACPGLVLINGYGPSENSVLSTTHRIEWNYDVRVPIGKPVSNSTAYILDPYGKFLPVGAIGELCVGLDGVARGYLNKPELTHEKFVPDPVYPHGTMFKTGDLARWLPDGSIDFLGRADYQVKVRGYRLELQEIENELGQLEGMGACAVLVRSEPDREKELVAFMVSERKWTAAKAKQSLLSRLPAYAVPTRFVQLEELPLTVNGKIDKKALLRLPLGPVEVAQAPSPVSMERMVLDIWKEVLGTDQIGLEDHFFDIGGNSLLTVQISDKLQKSTGFELSVTDLFRYPSIRELAGYLSNQREPAASAAEQPPRVEADNRSNGENGGREQAMQATSEIAIVGLSARLPGASGIEEFWRNLEEGRESISFFSDEELRSAGIGESDWSHPDYVKAKGVLEDIEHFDAGLFEYSPHEAELMDPQLRILHECAWSCLENAGYDPGQYDKPIGLFVGASVNLHWVNHLFNTLEDDTERWRAANLNVHSLSMPVSYKLNLKGPSLTIETACSSSLVGVHLACRSLLDRECGMALAGGVSVTLPKKSGYHYQDGMIKSPDGHCRAFDAEAKGTVSGDGAGMVALKRLDDALADGDHIYAIIKGTAINNDGSRKVGFTAPSIEGQIEVVTAAQRAGAIPPESISYIEAHGTATPLGDPTVPGRPRGLDGGRLSEDEYRSSRHRRRDRRTDQDRTGLAPQEAAAQSELYCTESENPLRQDIAICQHRPEELGASCRLPAACGGQLLWDRRNECPCCSRRGACCGAGKTAGGHCGYWQYGTDCRRGPAGHRPFFAGGAKRHGLQAGRYRRYQGGTG